MLSFFPRDVLDEILNLIESVSEGFPTYYNVHFYNFPKSPIYVPCKVPNIPCGSVENIDFVAMLYLIMTAILHSEQAEFPNPCSLIRLYMKL